MAKIFEKISTDKTMILAPREAFLRGFDFGAWTDIRMGIYFSGVDGTVDDDPAVVETIALAGVESRFSIGIKNNSSANLPGEVGCSFIGAGNIGAYGITAANDSYTSGASAGRMGVLGLEGAATVGSTELSFAQLAFPIESAALVTGYCGFMALRFQILNLGDPTTQQVVLYYARSSPIAGTDYSANALETAIGAAALSSAALTLDWNDGGTNAYTIPNAIFIRFPFYNNRIRISAMAAVKYA